MKAALSIRRLDQRYPQVGQTLAAMDANIAAGSEDRVMDAVARIAGRPSRALVDFIAANADVWRPV